jgi:thymidylate kinase
MGIDGSGKTTHAISLSKNLSKVGVNSLYIRPEYLLERCLPQALIRWVSQHVFASSKMKIGRSGFVRHQENDVKLGILKFMLTVGFLIYVWLMYTLIVKPRLGKYVLIYDRYFYDWIYYLDKKRSTVLMQLAPKPNLIFLLDVGIPEAFSRMRYEGDKEFSAYYYSSLRNWYLTLAKKYGFIVINSDCEFNEIKHTIFKHTIALLKRRGLFV